MNFFGDGSFVVAVGMIEGVIAREIIFFLLEKEIGHVLFHFYLGQLVAHLSVENFSHLIAEAGQLEKSHEGVVYFPCGSVGSPGWIFMPSLIFAC